MAIHHKSKNGPIEWKKQQAWLKPPPKRLKSWKVRCFIFQCKDIPAADSDGSSDPYISLWNQDNKKIQTQVVEDNVNPIFFEALELYYDFDSLADAPPVVFNIWDKDQELLDSGDDFLGRCVVYLSQASVTNDDRIPDPRWHDIKISFHEKEPACGQMLVSFSLVEDDYTYKIPINYLNLVEQIEYKEYQVDINVLGLRSLESFGLMPVKKPFIKFNLRSLLPPDKAQAVTNIKTQPSAPGPNPNINTLINFALDLPVNPLFCPKLSCDVYDYVYKGLVQPLLGTFTISIGEIMHEQRLEKEQLMEISNEIIGHLREVQESLDNNLFEEKKEEPQRLIDFKGRVEALNQQADQMFDASRITHDTQDKQKLITEGPETSILSGPRQPEDNIHFDESSSLMEQQPSKSKGEEQKSGSKSGNKTPLDFSPAKLKKKMTQGLFSKENKLLGEVGMGINYKLLIEKTLKKEQEKFDAKNQRVQDAQQLKQAEFSEEAHKNVLLPKYVFDERLKIHREINKPPASLYIGLGHNKTPEEDKKHYRKFYDDELENCEEIFKKKVFYQVAVHRGQTRGLQKGFFSFFSKSHTDESGQESNYKEVGKFKGRINVENANEKEQFKQARESRIKIIFSHLNEIHEKKFNSPLPYQLQDLEQFEMCVKFTDLVQKMGVNSEKVVDFLRDQSYEEMLTKQLLVRTNCMVRLYVLEGFDFAQRDIGSFSDPYLVLQCGNKQYNERDNYQLDEPNPKFFKMYEFQASFPGAEPLVIKAYDYDDLFGDDLIGETSIDLDDRFFCPDWQQINDKPIEFRQLYHPSTQVSQGVIKCWTEIHMTSKQGQVKLWDITPEPVLDYEVRVCIYDTLDVVCADVEGTSDVFIKAFIDDKDKKETDTHFRCQNGKASFNYRLLFDAKAPRQNYNLTLQVWDRDLFKSNDFIGETQFPLHAVFEDAISTQKPISITKKYFQTYFKSMLPDHFKTIKFYDEDTFYVACLDADKKIVGQVRIGINITPKAMADANPVGHGRTEPNHSPFLPPPVGRVFFSLNPFTMINQLVGPEIRKKFYTYCCAALCIALCIAMLPMILSNMVSNMIVSIF